MPSPTLAAAAGFWMPQQASTVAANIDWLFFFILWINIIFTALIGVLLVLFAIKYRRRGVEKVAAKHAGHSTALEITWTIIPTIIVLIVFYYGFRDFLDINEPPADAYEIQVDAKAWSWTFIYPNGVVDTELHLPRNKPVRFVLGSSDVIHSLYLPQMRLKKDAVPGRFNKYWVQATELSPVEGFDVFCTEYCGTNHSTMLTRARVYEQAEFNAKMVELADWTRTKTPLQAGENFYRTRSCMQCHSLDGTAGQGPTWKDLFGNQRTFTDGSSVVADENYIMESIKYPSRHIVTGFTNIMPSFLGTLNDRDIGAIITFMKSQSVHYKGGDEPASQPAAGSSSQPSTTQPTAPQPH